MRLAAAGAAGAGGLSDAQFGDGGDGGAAVWLGDGRAIGVAGVGTLAVGLCRGGGWG